MMIPDELELHTQPILLYILFGKKGQQTLGKTLHKQSKIKYRSTTKEMEAPPFPSSAWTAT